VSLFSSGDPAALRKALQGSGIPNDLILLASQNVPCNNNSNKIGDSKISLNDNNNNNNNNNNLDGDDDDDDVAPHEGWKKKKKGLSAFQRAADYTSREVAVLADASARAIACMSDSDDSDWPTSGSSSAPLRATLKMSWLLPSIHQSSND